MVKKGISEKIPLGSSQTNCSGTMKYFRHMSEAFERGRGRSPEGF